MRKLHVIEKYRKTWHPTHTHTLKLGYIQTHSSLHIKHAKEHFHMMYNTQVLYC